MLIASGCCSEVLEVEIELRGRKKHLCDELGWVDLQRALARSGGEALLPQCFRQSSKRERVTHLHERVPLALRLACFWHLQHVLGRREGFEETAEFRLGAACWHIADHHLRAGKPLSAIRVQAELLRPSACETGCTWTPTFSQTARNHNVIAVEWHKLAVEREASRRYFNPGLLLISSKRRFHRQLASNLSNNLSCL